MKDRNMPTYHTLVVLGSILRSVNGRIYGNQLIDSHNIPAGTLYPILHWLVKEGILVSEREKGSMRLLGRWLQIYYRLTPRGKRYAERYNAVVIASNPPLIPFNKFS